jgi:hypothetical protein
LTQIVTTRKEAKEQGLSRYFTGKPCKYGHVSERSTSTRICVICKNEYKKQHVLTDPDYYSNLTKTHRHKKRSNKAAKCASQMKRIACQLQRTPAWAELEDIKKLYEQCSKISESTGILHHVDHYYPLQGTTVSGLHVLKNLRIISAEENIRKGNKHPDEI